MTCQRCGIDLATVPTPCPWGFYLESGRWTALLWIRLAGKYTCGKCARKK